MITSPPIDELLERVPSKYALVILASKRARQLNTYRLEGQIDTSLLPPQVAARSRNHLTTALEVLAAGKLDWEDPAQLSVGKCS